VCRRLRYRGHIPVIYRKGDRHTVAQAPAHRWLRRIAAAALLPAAVAAASPAAAAQQAPASVSTHPPGYKIVRAGPFNAPPSAFDSGGSATCPAGTVVWGGGVAFSGGSNPSLTVNTFQPAGSSGWEARVNNTGATTVQFVVDAVCANKPAGYKLVFKTVDNPANTQSHATATCPSPKVLLSGGTLSTSDQVPAILTSAWPKSSAQFTGYMLNGTATDQKFTVLAICGQKPAGYKIASNGVPLDPGFTLGDGIGCPAGTSVLGGGTQDPDHVRVVQVGGSVDQGASAWEIDVNNTGKLVHQVNGYAVCAA
jgi:hypothetical protein